MVAVNRTNEELLTDELLDRLFEFDADRAWLIWKAKPSRNRRVRVGDRAGCLNKTNRYRRVRINGKCYLEHRVIWRIVKGRFPPDELHHRNHIRDDNRIGNLEEATSAQNNKEGNHYPRTKYFGYPTGVAPTKPRNSLTRYTAVAKIKRKQYHIGTFDTVAEAAQAYLDFHKGTIYETFV